MMAATEESKEESARMFSADENAALRSPFQGAAGRASPALVAVCGFASNVGKTTLVCDLLGALAGWEAIKITRGHYRSCGKDPHACCVSHLLGSEPLVRTGRADTYAPGKDTGRYWDAGASNVHWLIATGAQVGLGVRRALSRVSARGVVVEGTSFLEHVEADFAIMVARADGGAIKPTARRALRKCSAIYLSDESGDSGDALARFAAWARTSPDRGLVERPPVYTRGDLPRLVALVNEACARAKCAATDEARDAEREVVV
jgi:molybdopterin-guanine dinucleotide biosynthesis protein